MNRLELLASILLLLTSAANIALAQEAATTEGDVQAVDGEVEAEIPESWGDPAYERFVDLGMLQEAWSSLNASALADAGLQLAEGERRLGRPHQAITANQVLRTATRVAIEKGDQATLKRIGRAASALRMGDLAAAVESAERLASQNRSSNSAVAVDLTELTETQLANYKTTVTIAESARIHGDRKTLDQLAKDVPEADFSEEVLAQLLRVVERNRSDAPERGDAATEALNRLQAGTRGKSYYFRNPLPFTVVIQVKKYASSGWQTVVIPAFKTVRVTANAAYVQWRIQIANLIYSKNMILKHMIDYNRMRHETAMAVIRATS